MMNSNLIDEIFRSNWSDELWRKNKTVPTEVLATVIVQGFIVAFGILANFIVIIVIILARIGIYQVCR